MKPALLDTDIISYFLRGNMTVREKVANYLQEYNSLNLSIITYYEIYSGLHYRDSQNMLSDFKDFVALNKETENWHIANSSP